MHPEALAVVQEVAVLIRQRVSRQVVHLRHSRHIALHILRLPARPQLPRQQPGLLTLLCAWQGGGAQPLRLSRKRAHTGLNSR